MSLSSDIRGLRKASTLRALEGRVPLAASFCQPLWSFQAQTPIWQADTSLWGKRRKGPRKAVLGPLSRICVVVGMNPSFLPH